MFKLVKNLAVWWPVTVLEPDPENPGTLLERAFEAKFVIRGKDEMKPHNDKRSDLAKRLMQAIKTAGTADDIDAAGEAIEALQAEIEAHDRQMYHLMVSNWRGIIGDDDQPIDFSAEALDMAISLDRVRDGLNRAYQDAVSNDKARLGNSKPSPAAGPPAAPAGSTAAARPH